MTTNRLAAAVAALAAATLTGCSTGPAPTSTSPSKSALQEYERSIKRDMEASGAEILPVSANRPLAQAAAQDGVPFAFAYDNRPGTGTCTWLRLPDRSLWSLNTGGALSRDTHAETLFREHPGAAVALLCDEQPAPVGLDVAAADSANAAGTPYRWRDGCSMFVRVPGSLDKPYQLPDRPTAGGDALGRVPADYVCNKRGN